MDTEHLPDLPPGFAWRDPRAVLCDGEVVGQVEVRVGVAAITLARQCVPRERPFATEAGARRFLAAWAQRWQVELRVQVRNRRSSAAATYRAPDDCPAYAPIAVPDRPTRRRR